MNKLDVGYSGKRLAIDFNVSESAISYIKSNKAAILDAVSSSFQEAKKKSLHKPEYPKMEEKLYEWFLNQRQKKCERSDFQSKGQTVIHNLLSREKGWLIRCKQRMVREIQKAPRNSIPKNLR